MILAALMWWGRMGLAILLLAGCAAPPETANAPPPVVETALPAPAQTARIDGGIGGGGLPRGSLSHGGAAATNSAAPVANAGGGDISLDFADTDIRTVVAQILGTILQQNYAIDPAVQGKATLRTVTPLGRDALIPVLQTLLAQNNAVLVRENGFDRVVPADADIGDLAGDDALGGAVVVSLRYAQAAALSTTLEPYISATGRILIAGDQNALIVQGTPAGRQALVDLIRAFDVDGLAGQAYELFPVADGDADGFAAGFSAALDKSGGAGGGPVTVLPLARIGAVLVIARNDGQLADARRVAAVLNQVERETLRSWHVYYVRNGRAGDAAYVLQQAFTPDAVTVPPAAAGPAPTASAATPVAGGDSGNGATVAAAPAAAPSTAAPGDATDQTSGDAGTPAAPPAAAAAAAAAPAMRIISDDQNNSVLVYGTAGEVDRVDATLAKIDIAPLQVRIDATIAEVDLTGALQYGTQFFFKSGDINAALSTASSAALNTSFPGFVLSGGNADAAPLAISALQSVTKVKILSSPELMVLDGQAASLQVGSLVPYLSQTSQSTVGGGAPVINSIDYRQTGVILQVTPFIGGNGVVTLDVAQEVSGVAPATGAGGINSPIFTERAVTSRVAIEDGQTIGLAGLISDSDSHQNQGIPYLKNVPLLGDLFGTQNNFRARTELLVLITPHVIRTQQDAAALAADMRDSLPDAAGVPALSRTPAVGGSADPDAGLRGGIQQ